MAETPFRPVTIEDTRVVTHEAAPTNSGSVGGSVGDGPPLVEHYTPDSIRRHFRHYQKNGCRDQTFHDNGPHMVESLLARLATAETALADRDRHFMWDDRLRMEREIGTLAAERDRLVRFVASGSAIVERHTETRATGCVDQYRMPSSQSWFDTPEAAVADWLRAPSTGTTPP